MEAVNEHEMNQAPGETEVPSKSSDDLYHGFKPLESMTFTPRGKVGRIFLKLEDFDGQAKHLKFHAKCVMMELLKSRGMRKSDLARIRECRPQYIQKALSLDEGPESSQSASLEKLLELFQDMGYDYEIVLKPAKN